MLRTLRIQNIILIQEAELEFEPGFTVLTGETGAGKSAILKALGLVLGERADSRLIRKGADRARVEAAFEIDDLPGVVDLLEQAGIDHEEGEPLLIRRDLSGTGKSRAFVNNTMAQQSLVKQLGDLLLDLVGQHSNLRLSSPDYQLETVDLFGGLREQAAEFSALYQQLRIKQKELESLVAGEAERLRELGRLRAEVEELENAAIKADEETELFSEYSRLAHSEELGQLLSGAQESLNGQLLTLKGVRDALTRAIGLDPDLQPHDATLKSTYLELEELSYSFRDYCGALESDPHRLTTVNERLSLIAALQKKYGNPAEYLAEASGKLAALDSADLTIEDLEKEVADLQSQTDKAAKRLTTSRKKAALALQSSLIEHLRPLNMQSAQLEIALSSAPRTSRGDDTAEFLFAPNVGEGTIPVRKCASGGELSRVLLALKTSLAGLELTPTLIFDEIDAALGGKTGLLVGQKLSAIGSQRQVICITHLPQVARQADHQFQISKHEHDGRTFSQVRLLDGEARRGELTRMTGDEVLVS